MHAHTHTIYCVGKVFTNWTNGIVLAMRVTHKNNHLFFTDPKNRESFVTNHQHVIGVDIEPWTLYIEICDLLGSKKRNHNNKLSKMHLIMLSDIHAHAHARTQTHTILHFFQFTRFNNNNVLIKFLCSNELLCVCVCVCWHFYYYVI